MINALVLGWRAANEVSMRSQCAGDPNRGSSDRPEHEDGVAGLKVCSLQDLDGGDGDHPATAVRSR